MLKRTIIIFLCATPLAWPQYSTRVGGGGVSITPRGIDFRTRPQLSPAPSNFSVVSTSLDMPLQKAKEVLLKTNLITGAALGDRSEISEQALAFASILYYANKSSAQFAFEEILNSAEYPEGRIYAAMGLYNFGGKSVIDNLLKNADKSRIVSVLIGSKMHEVQLGKFFETFLRDTSLFIPDISILRRTTTIQNTQSIEPVYVIPSRPPVIIRPQKPPPRTPQKT